MEENLALFECPFTWNVPDVPVRDEFMEKLQNEEEQTYFLMNGFSVYLLECFERFRNGELEVAVRKVKEFEIELEEYLPVGQFADTDRYIWNRCKEGIEHVFLSTQAHLAFHSGDMETLDKIIEKIKPVESLDNSSLSAIFGIKCRFFMAYGPFETTKSAISYGRKAIELDKTIPLWHFYLGKSLARYRRANSYNDPPSKEEIRELELAFSESKTPDKAVMLLETYAEMIKGRRLPNQREIEAKCKKLLEIIKETAGDEWYVYWRCAHLSLRLPSKIVTRTEIKTLIEMAVESSERNHNADKCLLNSLQCNYYKSHEQNLTKALEFGEKAAESGAIPSALDVISIKYRLNNEEDMIPVLDKYINQPNLQKGHEQLLTIKANYLLYVKKQIKEAFDIYFRVMEANPQKYFLLNCRPFFQEVNGVRGYSVYDRVLKEIENIIYLTPNSSDIGLYKEYKKKILELGKKSLKKN
ncbi:uncharacterized protein LOC142334336 isoform X2 [Lycorma delicatula]|uniref:uncharacterized protein LOC142334336 isoform X2 n=1 Tax=Lycorma delicatula TaxID=130591 RepID=UPI003F50EBBE